MSLSVWFGVWEKHSKTNAQLWNQDIFSDVKKKTHQSKRTWLRPAEVAPDGGPRSRSGGCQSCGKPPGADWRTSGSFPARHFHEES